MLRKVTVLRPLVFKPMRQSVQRFCGISNSLKLEFYLRNWDDLYEHRHTKKLEQALKSAISSPPKVSLYLFLRANGKRGYENLKSISPRVFPGDPENFEKLVKTLKVIKLLI